jgi:hypothetical protein
VGWAHHERVDRECGVYSGATEQAYRREHHHETPENQRPIGGRQGYQDLVQISDPKPYVSLEGLRNIQRLIKIQNPPIGNVKLEELIENRPLKKLEDSGFVQKTYAAYGVIR